MEKLYQVWRKIRSKPCCDEWSTFDAFYDWAMEHGYQVGAWIQRFDATQPFGPKNCVVRNPKEKVKDTFTDEEKAWADGWNYMVNRIRKRCGMEPLEGTEHGN